MNNLELYRVFRAVAEEGSFSAAAKALYISQPAVSQAIKQLETNLSVLLFVRRAKGVTLTSEGEMLFSYVKNALSLLETGEQKLNDMKQLLFGELRIGAGDTVSQHFLLPYLERFHNRYPGIRLRVINRTSGELAQRLRQGTLDVALLNLPEKETGLSFFPILSLEDVFVAGSKFQFLEGREVTWAALNQYPLIMLEQAASSRRHVDRAFLQKGLVLTPEIELGAHDLLISFARIGLGIACVTRQYLSQEDTEGLFTLQLEEPIPGRILGLAWPEKITPSFVASEFIRWCRENMPSV